MAERLRREITLEQYPGGMWRLWIGSARIPGSGTGFALTYEEGRRLVELGHEPGGCRDDSCDCYAQGREKP